jgi:hypothetical protein
MRKNKHSSLLGPFISDQENKCRIYSTSFSLRQTNWPNKLECYSTISSKILLRINTLTYWAHFVSYEEYEVSYLQHFIFFATNKLAQ